ncbi:head-tail adaptor protein [Fusobacterium sp. IOR10]|uniref:phage head completion protein n=1 Tax=Fusobacterium sp. IOR10 TaxID=2665157 RepID=UPI0013CF458D|nr:head-tail adaptor protein [Fusobacterium sp. IOR10]
MYKRNEQDLSSRLNNRIEVRRKEKINTSLGVSYQEVFYKKIWANIIPLTSLIKNGQGETEYSQNRLKIIIRKTKDIQTTDLLIIESQKYEIESIIPNFNLKDRLEIRASLKVE